MNTPLVGSFCKQSVHNLIFQDLLVISKSFLIMRWLYIGTPWIRQQKSILPFNVFPLISGISIRCLCRTLSEFIYFQYPKRSKRSSPTHTNWYIRWPQIWSWQPLSSPWLLSSQNILRQGRGTKIARRRKKSSETKDDSEWETETGWNVSWHFW